MASFASCSIHRCGSSFQLKTTLLLIVWMVVAGTHTMAATIVLDPGHGGSDKGAVSGSAFTEKHYTLSLAQRIADRLGGKHRIELTRKADIAMTPDDRAGAANHLQADLMVSIHAAVAPHCGDRTAAVYYHDDEHLVIPSVGSSGEAFNKTDDQRLAWNRLQMRHQLRSLQVARWIKQALEESDTFDSVSVYPVPLVALLGADLPAVLLEVGCIHPAAPPDTDELERQLNAYAESIAAAIDMAIEEPIR